MNDKFFDLKKEKQDRMINAALKVFAKYGYGHASTDDIVREAAISKGLLFHYFESKLGTYAFVYQYSVRYVILELGTAGIGKKETGKKDIFTIARQLEQARWQILKGYPYLLGFLKKADGEEVSEALAETESMKEKLRETVEKIKDSIDPEGLPAGTDVNRLFSVLQFTMDGLMKEQFDRGAFQPDMLHEEVLAYISMLEQAYMVPKEQELQEEQES